MNEAHYHMELHYTDLQPKLHCRTFFLIFTNTLAEVHESAYTPPVRRENAGSKGMNGGSHRRDTGPGEGGETVGCERAKVAHSQEKGRGKLRDSQRDVGHRKGGSSQ